MTKRSDLSTEISGARAYELLHVPALFGQWCTRILDAAGVQAGHRVLDVACGTGVLARAAASRVEPGGHVAGVDPDPGMLVVATELAPQVEWREATAESLPYSDESFDTVVCQFGMMFFSDRHQGLREMLRVLRPGGRLAIAVWDSLENSEAYPLEVELLERVAGSAAADALRAPFALGDVHAFAALLEEFGLRSLTLRTETGRAQFPTIRAMVEVDLRGWLPVMGIFLEEAEIRQILDESESVLARYATEDGVIFKAPAHIATATKP